MLLITIKISIEQNDSLPDSLPGIDIKKVINELNLQKDTLKRILLRFMERNTNTMDKVWEAYNQKDLKSLGSLAHSIKGSGGNIGADDLYKAALEIENACKKKSVDPNLVVSLDAAFKQVLKSLKGLSDESSD